MNKILFIVCFTMFCLNLAGFIYCTLPSSKLAYIISVGLTGSVSIIQLIEIIKEKNT